MSDTHPSPAPFEQTSAPGLRVVVMGVSGCGKSSVGQGIAKKLSLPLVEGDEYHPERNIQKMQHGIALIDEDRADWLFILGETLASNGGMVLTCSALKASYRNLLRHACSTAGRKLFFVHLAISQAESLRRVGSRKGHFFAPSLVASQFETLQDPTGEPGVLTLDGEEPIDALAQQAADWLATQATSRCQLHQESAPCDDQS